MWHFCPDLFSLEEWDSHPLMSETCTPLPWKEDAWKSSATDYFNESSLESKFYQILAKVQFKRTFCLGEKYDLSGFFLVLIYFQGCSPIFQSQKSAWVTILKEYDQTITVMYTCVFEKVMYSQFSSARWHFLGMYGLKLSQWGVESRIK